MLKLKTCILGVSWLSPKSVYTIVVGINSACILTVSWMYPERDPCRPHSRRWGAQETTAAMYPERLLTRPGDSRGQCILSVSCKYPASAVDYVSCLYPDCILYGAKDCPGWTGYMRTYDVSWCILNVSPEYSQDTVRIHDVSCQFRIRQDTVSWTERIPKVSWLYPDVFWTYPERNRL